ncbi:MAG: HAMP domain-containing histidine kinase [Cohnella sp.]|nr:HAMP domain-containing histidine kinase [Cohnella sp.]
MSIRLKLILTYIIGILLTAMIVAVTGIGLVTAVVSYFANGIAKDQTTREALGRGIDVIVDLRYAEKYKPEELTSPAFASLIGDQLRPFEGFLVVQEGERWESYGALKEEDAFLAQLRKDVSKPGKHADGAFTVSSWEGRDLLALRYDFPAIDDPLTYYLVIDVTEMWTKGDRFPWFVLLGIAILLGIILVPLIWITTKDIVRPLRQLEYGSRRIAEGDLNFSLQSKVRNEVGSVIRSYEQMRGELQRSIGAQLALEENRKELISNISHDLKTPLTSIKGYVEGIRDDRRPVPAVEAGSRAREVPLRRGAAGGVLPTDHERTAHRMRESGHTADGRIRGGIGRRRDDGCPEDETGDPEHRRQLCEVYG